MNHLQDKVIVITGAGGGFGKLVAEKALGLGAKVVAADVNKDALKQLTVTEYQGALVTSETDVTDVDQMHQLGQLAVERFGSLDVWINNAGTMPLAFFSDHEAARDAWHRCIDINFKGVLNGITAAHDHMIRQGRGHVVNLSSIYGNFPVAGGGVYGATKAAVDFLSESLRQESLGKIKVTNVKPTGVPATGLSGGIVNPAAISGILGSNAERYMQRFADAEAGQIPEALLDSDNIEYFALAPEYLAEQIIYAINQPWGVVISEITVRASGDAYVI